MLKENHFATVKFNNEKTERSLYVKMSHPLDKKYLVLDFRSKKTFILLEDRIETVISLGRAPFNLSSWPKYYLVGLVYAETEEIHKYFDPLTYFLRGQDPDGYTSKFDICIDTWSKYRNKVSSLCKLTSVSHEQIQELLKLRAKFMLGKVFPMDKVLSRSTRRKLKNKEKFRQGQGEGRKLKVIYPMAPSNSWEIGDGQFINTVKKKFTTSKPIRKLYKISRA